MPPTASGAVIVTLELRAELGADPRQVALARRLLSDRLPDWGLDGDEGEVAVLLTSELVTNAILHGMPPVELVAFPVPDGLRVEVHDTGDGSPTIRDAGEQAVDGRGLHLVNTLAHRWGAIDEPAGKVVWFEVLRSS